MFQTTSTRKFIVLAVLKDRLFQTTSIKKVIVLTGLEDKIHQEIKTRMPLYLQHG